MNSIITTIIEYINVYRAQHKEALLFSWLFGNTNDKEYQKHMESTRINKTLLAYILRIFS